MALTRADCADLDLRDPLAEHRRAFVLPDGVIYLDGSAPSELPSR